MVRVLTDTDSDEVELDREQLRVINWRIEWYRRSGYKDKNAVKLAYRDDINYRFACELLELCEDEELAMSILV